MAGIRAVQTGGMTVNAGGASTYSDSSSIATGSPVEFSIVGRTPTSYRWTFTVPANSKSALNVVTGVTLTPATGAAPIAHLLDIPGAYVITCTDDTGLSYSLTLNVQQSQATVYPGPLAPFYGPPGAVSTPSVGCVLYCDSTRSGQLTVMDVSGTSTPFGSTFLTLSDTTFPASALAPTIYQAQATSANPDGQALSISGQSAYAVGNNSTGDLSIGAGVPHGTGTAGRVLLQSNGVTQVYVGTSGVSATSLVAVSSVASPSVSGTAISGATIIGTTSISGSAVSANSIVGTSATINGISMTPVSGTWSPGLTGRTTPGTQTYSTNSGYYLRIGNLVFVRGEIVLTSNSGGTGDAIISLPIATASGVMSALTIAYTTNIAFATSAYSWFTIGVDASSTRGILFENQDNGARHNVAITQVATDGKLCFSGTYMAA